MRRRAFLAGVVAAGAAVTAGLYRFTGLFAKHYPPTPYDDVLAQLTDRAQAARLGASVKDAPDAKTLAARLRETLRGGSLKRAAEADAAAGLLLEADGWLLPQSVALLSALAAKV